MSIDLGGLDEWQANVMDENKPISIVGIWRAMAVPGLPESVDEGLAELAKYGLDGPPRDSGEFYCESRKCAMCGHVVSLPWREEPVTGRHYPLCPTCGDVMRENVSAPNVIWTGSIGQRYRDKDKDGYHNPDGQIVYTRKTPDGKPKPVLLENWSDVRSHCKREGLTDPRELPRNFEVAENGKDVLNTRGMPGTEL